MSEFIERSKHPEMTRQVEDHIMGKGQLPAAPHELKTFNVGDKQKGVNYVLRADAGHYVRSVKGL